MKPAPSAPEDCSRRARRRRTAQHAYTGADATFLAWRYCSHTRRFLYHSWATSLGTRMSLRGERGTRVRARLTGRQQGTSRHSRRQHYQHFCFCRTSAWITSGSSSSSSSSSFARFDMTS